MAPETDPLWQAMQRDELTEREYWAIRARELGTVLGDPSWDTTIMLQRVRQGRPQEVVRPEVRALLTEARARGLRLGILSNEMELFYGQEYLLQMDVLHFFDAIVDATHTHILKPDSRAYQLAVGKLQVPAADVLFVDDQFRNITGALRAGLQVHYFDLRDIAGNIAAIAARLRISPRSQA
jgi:putative hydrolase of the HAD superfamily